MAVEGRGVVGWLWSGVLAAGVSGSLIAALVAARAARAALREAGERPAGADEALLARVSSLEERVRLLEARPGGDACLAEKVRSQAAGLASLEAKLMHRARVGGAGGLEEQVKQLAAQAEGAKEQAARLERHAGAIASLEGAVRAQAAAAAGLEETAAAHGGAIADLQEQAARRAAAGGLDDQVRQVQELAGEVAERFRVLREQEDDTARGYACAHCTAPPVKKHYRHLEALADEEKVQYLVREGGGTAEDYRARLESFGWNMENAVEWEGRLAELTLECGLPRDEAVALLTRFDGDWKGCLDHVRWN